MLFLDFLFKSVAGSAGKKKPVTGGGKRYIESL